LLGGQIAILRELLTQWRREAFLMVPRVTCPEAG
jgi:hypothetical protein